MKMVRSPVSASRPAANPYAAASVDFLLAIARASGKPDTRATLRRLAEHVEDWPSVIEFANRHTVIPLLARSLRDCDAVPLPVRKELYRRHFENKAQNTLLAGELRDVVGACAEAGIEVLAYKGPALAMLAYGDLALRHPPGDIDLLFGRHDVPRAKRLLEARGYRIYDPEREQHHLEYRYHLHYQRQDPELHCEVHWGLTPVYWRFEMDEQRLWAGARVVPIAGASVRTLSPECALLALCAHGAKEGWPKLSQVVDLARLIEAHPSLDWDWVLGESRRMRRERVVHLGLWLANHLLGAEVPGHVKADMEEDRDLPRLGLQVRANFAAERIVGSAFHRYALRVWRQPRDRVSYLAYLALLLPRKIGDMLRPSSNDEAFLNLGRLPRGLYLFVRPFRVLWQYRNARLILRTVKRNL
jgi:hypothetical protein